jgi:hypothetical protein
MPDEEVKLRHRGREVTATDLEFIRRLIAEHPEASRRRLSALLCEAWNWRQPNGELRDMVCRSLMLELYRADLITLPPVRARPPNNVVRRRPPPERTIDAIDTSPLEVPLGELRPLEFQQVRRSEDEKLFEALVAEHHYLGYTQPVGEHLKYVVRGGTRVLACLAWSSAPRHLGPRDRFIGWSAKARRSNIHLLAYNTRFLVLPWVRVKHLASHILARMAKVVAEDWQRIYGHPIHYLESFVEPGRFRGTCYRAANWEFLGLTTGRGKADQTKKPNRPLKEVLGYPLTRRFRELLGGEE